MWKVFIDGTKHGSETNAKIESQHSIKAMLFRIRNESGGINRHNLSSKMYQRTDDLEEFMVSEKINFQSWIKLDPCRFHTQYTRDILQEASQESFVAFLDWFLVQIILYPQYHYRRKK